MTTDMISRQAAIDAVIYATDGDIIAQQATVEALEQLPSAQSERLSDDDFETIREEYQRIIDRFVAFATAQPDSKETSSTQKPLDTISRQAAIEEGSDT